MHGKYTYSHYTFTFPILLSTNLRVPGGAGGGQDQADQEEEAGGVSAGGDLLHPLTDTSPLYYTTRRGPPTHPYDTTLTIASSHTTHRHHVIPLSRHHAARRAPRLSPAPRRTSPHHFTAEHPHSLTLSPSPRQGDSILAILILLGGTTYQPTHSPTHEQARHPVRQRHADGSLPPGVNWRSSELPSTSRSSAHPCSPAYSRSPAHSTLEERRVALAQQARPVYAPSGVSE